MFNTTQDSKLLYCTGSTVPENIFRNVLIANASSSCYVAYRKRKTNTELVHLLVSEFKQTLNIPAIFIAVTRC